jgi:hypothetical protein
MRRMRFSRRGTLLLLTGCGKTRSVGFGPNWPEYIFEKRNDEAANLRRFNQQVTKSLAQQVRSDRYWGFFRNLLNETTSTG